MPPKRKKPSHQLSPAKRLRRYRNEESQSKTQERLERNRQRNRATRRRNDLSRTAYQTASSPSHCMPLRSLSPLPSPPPPQQPPPPQPVPAVAARSYPPIVSSVSVDEEDQLPPPVSPVASRCSSPTSVISEDEEDQPISEDEGDQPSNAPSDPYPRRTTAGFSHNPTSSFTLGNVGPMNVVCRFCQAKRWRGEAPSICCSSGKVNLPPLLPPQPLLRYLCEDDREAISFRGNIRKYNSCFHMTSFGADRRILEPGFMPTFKIQGQVYHRLGSLMPDQGSQPSFLQIYFMDDPVREAH